MTNNLIFIRNMPKTTTLEEIVSLTNDHTKVTFEYNDTPVLEGQVPILSNGTAFNDLPPHRRCIDQFCSLWMSADLSEDQITTWCKEFERLRAAIRGPLSEEILKDDHPMTGGYMYVVDGTPRMCEWMASDITERRMTVGEYKCREGVSEVRRCDLYGRIDRQALKPERSDHDRRFKTQFQDDPSLQPHRWNKSGTRINQAHRKPRSSNKIKKVARV